jgi:hypothetical protein
MFCLVERKKKKKTKKQPMSFFPKAGYALLAVPHRIFTTLRSLIHFELIFVQEERDPLSASTTRRYPPNINC